MIRIGKPDLRFILVRIAWLACAAAILSLVAVLLLGAMNDGSDRGAAPADSLAGTTDPFAEQEDLWQGGEVVLPEQQMMSEGPESSWELTPCSLYVDGSSSAVVEPLPEAPTPEWKTFEALLVVRRWAGESGLGPEELDQVYVFTRMDTLYVDLPSPLDVDGLVRTLQSRFICFTRLFPLVAGNLLSGWPDGLPLRGVPGVFGN